MDNDKMMEALFAAHALPGLMNQMDARNSAAIASAAYSIADALMVEAKKREKERDRLRPRDQWGRPA